MVYGSDEERAAALRSFEGGRLLVSDGDLLPLNEAGLANAGGTSDTLFLAGDIRANEQIGLTAMHTLFVREHNFQADRIAAENPDLTDEEIFQQARAIVIAEIQAITYNEFLPALLGMDALGAYQGYDASVDPSISNLFSTAAYRFGHSMLSTELLRLNEDGTTADEGNISLSNAFFSPDEISENGIESILRGLAAQQAQEIDNMVIDDIRNFLFGPPGAGGFDLASLNIQRGRDHGLANYNQAREDLGLVRVTSFDQITSDPELAVALEELYGSVDNLDVWVGGLAEDHLPESSVGELFSTVIVDQFERLRTGDRFWYQNLFSGSILREIEQTKLSDIVLRNTEIDSIQENLFFDSSVIIHQVEGKSTSITVVRTTPESMEIIDASDRPREVVQSASLEDVSQIRIEGRDGRGDQIILDVARLSEDYQGDIVVGGGEGRGDVLRISGSKGEDNISIENDIITINGQTVHYSDFEMILVTKGPDDVVELAEELDTRVRILRQTDGNGPTGRVPVRPNNPRPEDNPQRPVQTAPNQQGPDDQRPPNEGTLDDGTPSPGSQENPGPRIDDPRSSDQRNQKDQQPEDRRQENPNSPPDNTPENQPLVGSDLEQNRDQFFARVGSMQQNDPGIGQPERSSPTNSPEEIDDLFAEFGRN